MSTLVPELQESKPEIAVNFRQEIASPQIKGRMRNKPCPCGSGAKFKRCCWTAYA